MTDTEEDLNFISCLRKSIQQKKTVFCLFFVIMLVLIAGIPVNSNHHPINECTAHYILQWLP